MDHNIMYGRVHIINPNKIPMANPHCAPAFYNQKLLEIASTNDAFFSLYVALIKLGSSAGLNVGKNVVDMIVVIILFKLKNQ